MFLVNDGKIEQDPDNLIHITYTRNHQGQPANFDFLIKYDRFDILNNAFNSPVRAQGEGGSMTVVSFNDAINFACEGQNIETFKKYLIQQAKKRVMFLASSDSELSQSLISSIAIEFRMRFPQIEQENWAEAFEVLWFEFVAFCVSLWTQCLNSAIEPHTGPNSFEYFRRLASSIAALIAKGADVFQVDRREFILSVRKHLNSGDPSEIPATSRSIVSSVGLALGNIRKRWILQLTDLFEFTQLFTASIAIAHSVSPQNTTKEMSNLSGLLSSWAISLVNNEVKGPKISDFKNSIEKLAVALLKATDSDRYGQDFHCTLALWKLSELTRATES